MVQEAIDIITNNFESEDIDNVDLLDLTSRPTTVRDVPGTMELHISGEGTTKETP